MEIGYEVVDGRRIETPVSSYYAGLVWTGLSGYLAAHMRRQNPCPGQLAIQVLFGIPLKKDVGRKRRPDLAFRLVWVVYPIQRCIHVFEAWDCIRVLTESDALDGGEVLPDFLRPLEGLFGPIEPENGKDA